MIDWYIKSRKLLRDLHKKSLDALYHIDNDDTAAGNIVASYLKADYKNFCDHWHSKFPDDKFGYLGRHVSWGQKQDFNDLVNQDIPAVEEQLDQYLIEFKKSLPNNKTQPYISEDRISELTDIENEKFATAKLIRLMNEINIAYNNDAFLSVGILVRAMIDHVPPIFGFSTFPEVANSYKGTKSFKASMQNLNNSLRNLSDSYLHVQIRKFESLPTAVQVDFRADVDALLSEISRILQDI